MVVTMLNNGKLMKPQVTATTEIVENLAKQGITVEEGDLVDYTDSKSSFGVTQKEAPFVETYNPDEDWTENFWFKDFSSAEKVKLIKKSNTRN